ncbi:MAG: phosphoethanolamine transferase CptA [Zoogloeaceae bacterium]|jgi:heptose-I-phosphate ethanolaminephosphotransferase|nr:phosphoethanolamine transferase CptA [Zoogloeaceae bacterium]
MRFKASPRPSLPSFQNPPKIDWTGMVWLFLFFWYFSALPQVCLLISGAAGFEGLRNTVFLSLVWLIPVLLLPRWTRPISALLGLMLWGAALVELGYFFLYGQTFSQTALFVMFESNPAESGEYFGQYFNFWLALGLLAYSGVAFLLWRRLRPVHLPRPHALAAVTLALLASLGDPLAKTLEADDLNVARLESKIQARIKPAVPWKLLLGYRQYHQQLNRLQNNLQEPAALPPLAHLKDANGDTPRTLVLVIGESTARPRMSLYGYARKTTPRLEVLRDSGKLAVFNQVVAPSPYTLKVMQQALTFADPQHPDRFLSEPSLMRLMKQAGYKTFWITNQQTMTRRNTLFTTFSQPADAVYYLNDNPSQNTNHYDEVVFAPFAEGLRDAAPKKFIVIHLLGAHSHYHNRYPAAHEKFTGRQNVPVGLSNEQFYLYNSYDNAILYNDFIVSRLMDMFLENDANGFLLYFSDHGEEVFDTPQHQRVGRDERAPTRNMYTIPFLLLTSPEWQKTHPLDLSALADRKYSSAHLIHTWSDLAGLSYDQFQPELSLVNPAFREIPRWIGDSDDQKSLRDFDALPH